MEVILKQSNTQVPISESWWYILYPGGASSQIVEIVSVYRKKVTVRGIENTQASWTVRSDHFDDLIYGWVEKGFGMLTEDYLYAIAAESDELLIGA